MTEASHQAYLAVVPSLPEKRRQVYEAIQRSGHNGATIGELCEALRRTPNCISGRLTELEKAGHIVDTSERRGGQTVYAIRYAGPATAPGKRRARRTAGRVVGRELNMEAANTVRITVEVAAGENFPDLGAQTWLRW